ncbi:MAG: hypothetical protein OEY23_22880 [Acidimicrobiia bacterium]|nr:hypothetical protein [Acidimicrobiia bacterium]
MEVPDAAAVVGRARNRRRARVLLVATLLVVGIAVPIVFIRAPSPTTQTVGERAAPVLPAGSVTEGAWASIPKAAAGIGEYASLAGLSSTGTAVLAVGAAPDDDDWDAAIWRSADGVQWTRARHPASTGTVTAIGVGGDSLLAVGTEGSDVDPASSWFVWRSSDDGRTWSSVAQAADLFGPPAPEMGRPFVDSLRWSEAGLWIAAGAAADGYAGVWTSSDGSRWTEVLPDNVAGSVDVVDTGSGFLAYFLGSAWTSWVGQAWTPVDLSLPESLKLREVAPGASMAIGVEPVNGESTPLLRSDDTGRHWTLDRSFLEEHPGAVAHTIGHYDALWVLAGFSGEPNRPDAWISADGDVWHRLPPALAGSPGGMLLLTAAVGGRVVMMGTAPELDRYYVLDAAVLAGTTDQAAGPSLAPAFTACPGSVARRAVEGTPVGADGLPHLDGAIIDPLVADRVLSDSLEQLRRTHPALVTAEVGPGFGRAWVGENGGDHRVVDVDDFGIVVHLSHEVDCPGADLDNAAIRDVPLFFVVDG